MKFQAWRSITTDQFILCRVGLILLISLLWRHLLATASTCSACWVI